MSWNGSWNEFQPHSCALGAFRAYSWDVGAGWAFAAPQRSSFNPWVQGSSPGAPPVGRQPEESLHVSHKHGRLRPTSPGEEDVACFGFPHNPDSVLGLSAVDLLSALALTLRKQ
jgi:hypothetical protein